MNESENRGKSGEPDQPDEFERQLIEALNRVDAPEGFAARVIESALNQTLNQTGEGATPGVKILPMRPRFAALRGRAWAGGAMAATLALGLLVAGRVHVRHEREQVVLAQQQFQTAMRLTDHALDQTRAQLKSAGFNLGN